MKRERALPATSKFYNLVRPNQALGYQTPDAFYRAWHSRLRQPR